TSLFGTKVGKFTEEEFDVAYKTFLAKGKMYVYTYFKDIPISTSTANQENLMTLWNFQKKLEDIKHFYTKYKSTEDLERQLREQLDKILEMEGVE
ncbi:MAG: hypothetical protein AAF573_17660, partial [Bacteroidota bacterium]